jgi:hypothetical protein
MISLADRLQKEADEITCYASTIAEHRPNGTAKLLRDAAVALDQAASLIFDGKPLYDEGTPEFLQWCLDARAWLNVHDGGFPALATPTAAIESSPK